jgi:hypothetical protein
MVLGEVLLIRTMVEIEQAILGMSQITGFRVNCYSIGCNSIDEYVMPVVSTEFESPKLIDFWIKIWSSTMFCPSLSPNQQAILNNDVTSITSININETFSHKKQNLLHLIASKRTYSVGRSPSQQNPIDLQTIKHLLTINTQLLDQVDTYNHTPLETALLHGATEIAQLFIDSTPSTPLKNINAVLPLIATHGMIQIHGVIEGEPPFSIDQMHLSLPIDRCIHQCLSGLGCRVKEALPDKWIASLKLLIPYWKPLSVPSTTHITTRSLIESAWGYLLRGRDHNNDDVQRNVRCFTEVVHLLQENPHVDLNPQYTGGIQFHIGCDLCHQRVNMGPARAWDRRSKSFNP